MTQSEDCLFLSVYSPNKEGTFPVNFWIHGGAFEQGLGLCALYNASTFAQNDVVSVVINYRLGALGFTASKSMKGNYGILDQRLALEWTRDNIKNFGGDPNRVTIAGQSAGAMSVGAHMISEGSKGLFHAAILESNPLALPYHTRDSAAKNAKNLFEYCGCADDDVACIKKVDVATIVKGQKEAVKLNFHTLLTNFLPFAPMVDKTGELREQPLYALAAGKFNPVPVLGGSMYDEGQLFVYELFTKPLNKVGYHSALDAVFGLSTSKKVKEMYPFDISGPDNDDGRNALNVMATDLLFYCPLRNITRGFLQQMGASASPAYIYRFKHVLSFDAWGPDYQFCVGNVCHGSELPFVYNVFTDGAELVFTPTPDEIKLKNDMVGAWSAFIKTGDPNKGSTLPAPFPRYQIETDPLVVLDEPGSFTTNNVRSEYCDLWDSIGYIF